MKKQEKTVRTQKQKAIRVIVGLLIATVVVTALYFIPYDKLLRVIFPEEENELPEASFFYDPDFSTDILSDPDYTGLDRYISFRFGNETFTVTDRDYAKYGHAAEVIAAYFEALIAGDAEGYRALFREEAWEENKPTRNPFPMQRLYDMKATLQQEHTFQSDELDGAYTGFIQYRYRVEYRISRNDGSVRRDVGSDESRPIYLELLKDPVNGETKINSISFPKS